MAFNTQILLMARQARSLSQAALAKKAKVSQGQLSKIENAQQEPSPEIIDLLANALGFPASLFEQNDQVYGLPLSVQPLYRKKASTAQKVLGRVSADINIRLMHLRRLLRSLDFEAVRDIPDLDPDLHGSPEQIAQKLRRFWQMPDGPVEDLSGWVEDAGIVVIECDFENASIAGVSYSIPDLPKCIFLAQGMVPDRWRFSLAHELGHIVMHQLPRPIDQDLEEEANRFAAEFLMPATDIKRELSRGKISLDRLALLKPKWKVAISALLYRAQQLNSINKNQAQYMWRKMSAMGIRLREPVQYDFKPEEPRLMKQFFKIHFNDLGYSRQDIADLLCVTQTELGRLYSSFWPKFENRHLSVV